MRILNEKSREVFERVAQREAWPSLWIAALCGVAAAVLVSLVAVVLIRFDVVLGFGVGLVVIASLALVALVTGVQAARQTAQDYTIIPRRKKIPRWVLVQGYALGALYRARLGLALTAGLIPVVAAGALAMNIIGMAQDAPDSLLAVDVIGPILFGLAVGIGAWGFNLLAASIGAIEGLRMLPGARMLLRTMLMPALLMISNLIVLMMVAPAFRQPFSTLEGLYRLLPTVGGTVVMLVPYWLTWFLIRTRQAA